MRLDLEAPRLWLMLTVVDAALFAMNVFFGVTAYRAHSPLLLVFSLCACVLCGLAGQVAWNIYRRLLNRHQSNAKD